MSAVSDARFWNRVARKYAAGPVADPAGYERTLERTRHYLRPGDVVLEIGCGSGATALKLAPFAARIVASDISSEMAAIGREKAAAENCANVEFVVAALDAPPWPDAAFDAVLSFNALHLIAGREAALARIHRLLKPGGLFISKTPCLKEANPLFRLAIPIMQALGQAPYVGAFSGAELEREIAQAGFDVVERGRHASRPRDWRPFLVARKT